MQADIFFNEFNSTEINHLGTGIFEACILMKSPNYIPRLIFSWNTATNFLLKLTNFFQIFLSNLFF